MKGVLTMASFGAAGAATGRSMGSESPAAQEKVLHAQGMKPGRAGAVRASIAMNIAVSYS